MFVFISSDNNFGLVVDDMILEWVCREVCEDDWVNCVNMYIGKNGD